MNTSLKSYILLLLCGLFISACSSQGTTTYDDRSEIQRQKAKEAQKELSKEIYR